MMVSNAVIVLSTIALGFITLSAGLGTYPFIMTPSISKSIEYHYIPDSKNSTIVISWIIHLLSFSIALICLKIGIMARSLKEKRRIEYAFKLQKLVMYSTIFINSAILMILMFSIIYFNVVHSTLHSCEKNYNDKNLIDLCRSVCKSPMTGSSSKSYCSKFALEIVDDDPLMNMIVTCIIGMCGLTIFTICLKRMFRIFRHKLELYQILLVEFIPDKQSEMANQYQPNMDIVPENEDEDTSSY